MALPSDLVQRLQAKDQTLTAINLSGTQLSVGDMASLATLLRGNQQVASLTLINCGLTAQHVAPLASLSSVAQVNVRNDHQSTGPKNNIGAEGCASLAMMQSLANCDVSYNNVGNEGFKAFAATTSLRRLASDSNKISSDGARFVTEHNPNITHYSVRINRPPFNDEGCKAIMAAAVGADFGGSDVRDWMLKVAVANSNLRSLGLMNCRNMGESVRTLVSTQIEDLDLYGALQYQSDNVKALAALASLKSVNLAFSRNLAADAVAAWAGHRNVEFISLQACDLSDSDVAPFLNNTTVLFMDLSHNGITPGMLDRIEARLDANRQAAGLDGKGLILDTPIRWEYFLEDEHVDRLAVAELLKSYSRPGSHARNRSGMYGKAAADTFSNIEVSDDEVDAMTLS